MEKRNFEKIQQKRYEVREKKQSIIKIVKKEENIKNLREVK